MKSLKKALRLIGLVLTITLASIGLGFNGTLLPPSKRQDNYQPLIEMVESKEDESDNTDQEKP